MMKIASYCKGLFFSKYHVLAYYLEPTLLINRADHITGQHRVSHLSVGSQ